VTIQPGAGRAPAHHPDSLADVLERVLDKGVVIAGDVVVNVLDIELLSLKLRLFVASAETAREMGMDWWTRDPFFSSQAPRQVDEPSRDVRELEVRDRQALEAENRELRQRLEALEQLASRGRLPSAQQADGEPRPEPGGS
jgi:hypothetical protein